MSSLTLKNITKSFEQARRKFTILNDVSLEIKSGEVCCLIGPSGCGKSTLLQIAGLLDQPTSGKIFIEGNECSTLSDEKITAIRGRNIGFVYQFHNLLGEFSALENIMMPLLILGTKKLVASKYAAEILKDFNLGHRLKSIPSELSGGEQQRVAIARALIHNPKILLADEPTGNLDSQNSYLVFDEFTRLAKKRNLAVLIATHNLELAKKADRILTINHGKVELYINESNKKNSASK